jgi:hypothetical protein
MRLIHQKTPSLNFSPRLCYLSCFFAAWKYAGCVTIGEVEPCGTRPYNRPYNDRLKDECLDIAFLNMDNNVFEKSKGEYTVRPVNICRKMREPCGFYAELIIVSTALYLLT